MAMKTKGYRYAIRDGFVGIFRHPLVLIASITTMMMLLYMTACFFAFSTNINHLVNIAGQQPPVEIVFKTTADGAMARQLDSVLEESDAVVFHELYTPEQNFENFKKNIGRDELYEGFDYKNRIPYTIQVRLKDPSTGEQFREEVKNFPAVSEVHLEQGVMEFLSKLKVQVNILSSVVFVALSLITIFIISNMTRVAALARSQEINIMKYLGATNRFIRIPFVLQGMIVGFIGATLAGVAYAVTYMALYNRFKVSDLMSHSFSLISPWQLLPLGCILIVLVGLMLGGLTSALSVRKHTFV